MSHTVFSKFTRFITVFFLISLAGCLSANKTNLDDLVPDPKYSPAEVVQIQMSALKDHNAPYQGAGIEITYRFASPANKVQTGPLERFKTLFDNPAYAPMLNYSKLEVGPTQNYDTSANVPIIITGHNGRKAAYIFRLNKQTQKPYVDCWMTSSVIRVAMDDPV